MLTNFDVACYLLPVRTENRMGRVKEIIEKYGLRDICDVRGVTGQKMDESCIEMFVNGDPSGNGKYLDWMLIQAGGGYERLEKSIEQWEKGDHGEAPIRETLRKGFIADAVAGYVDDGGKQVPPVTESEAIEQWEKGDHGEAMYRNYHIYGDEEYAITGFGFHRFWPGHSSVYEHIVQAVRRFHRHQAKLKSLGKSVDLSIANYPNLRDLQEALGDITFLEIRNDVDADTVYEDDYFSVVCPFNIGASMRYGHQKWCTANVSMFKAACSGTGPNRWKEYAKDAALYYCKVNDQAPENCDLHVNQIAVQAPFNKRGRSKWKFYDTADASHVESDILRLIGDPKLVRSFRKALAAMESHHEDYPASRLNLDLVVKA